WRDVAVDGITSALSAGISEGLRGAGNAAAAGKTYKTVDAVNNRRELNALGRVIQGVGNYAGGVVANTVVGRDTNFSWSAVAATAVGSYVSAKLGGKVPGLKGGDVTAVGLEGLGQSFVDGAINASARRLFGLGKQDWGQIGLQALAARWPMKWPVGSCNGRRSEPTARARLRQRLPRDSEGQPRAELRLRRIWCLRRRPGKARPAPWARALKTSVRWSWMPPPPQRPPKAPIPVVWTSTALRPASMAWGRAAGRKTPTASSCRSCRRLR